MLVYSIRFSHVSVSTYAVSTAGKNDNNYKASVIYSIRFAHLNISTYAISTAGWKYIKKTWVVYSFRFVYSKKNLDRAYLSESA